MRTTPNLMRPSRSDNLEGLLLATTVPIFYSSGREVSSAKSKTPPRMKEIVSGTVQAPERHCATISPRSTAKQ
jgi:hypothetical protein